MGIGLALCAFGECIRYPYSVLIPSRRFSPRCLSSMPTAPHEKALGSGSLRLTAPALLDDDVPARNQQPEQEGDEEQDNDVSSLVVEAAPRPVQRLSE